MSTMTNTVRKVLTIVAEQPGSTAAEVADETGLGRSTVTRILARLESEDSVTRIPGGREAGRRLPDRWSLPGLIGERIRARYTGTKARKASTTRLAYGRLQAMVLAHLQDHAGEVFTPREVAKALGRSPGAVGNALDKLVVAGSVIQAGDGPRRFTCSR